VSLQMIESGSGVFGAIINLSAQIILPSNLAEHWSEYE